VNNDGKIGSEYKPKYHPRSYSTCPHCGTGELIRTNRYLYRCTNYEECGRYW
jgi:ssDNA-binding Zn-finger/Zn-ribbon topoisomerase 1